MCACPRNHNPQKTPFGRQVEVDLETRTVTECALDEGRFRSWLGGRGLGLSYLYQTDCWGIDEVPLVFAVGPLAVFGVAASSRCSLVTRSPKTKTVFDSSAGGGFGARLAAAGVALLVLRGRAKHPTVVEVTPEGVSFTDAANIWDSAVDEFAAYVGDDASFAVVGSAASADVDFACVMVDKHHAFGRGGLGRLFHARNLKGVVVRAPLLRRQPADPHLFSSATDAIKRLLTASPPVKALSAFGTPFLVAITNWLGILPMFNFSKTGLEEAGALFADVTTAGAARAGCVRCPIACKRRKNGKPLPEYETVAMLGPNCGIFDYETIRYVNNLANRYGADTISLGGALAAFYAQKGVYPKPSDFIKDVEAVLEGKHQACEGAQAFGDAAVAVRNLELPAYDPRGCWGMGLAYATSTRGGCHLRGYMVAPEILRKPRPLKRFTFAGKAEYLAVLQDRSAVCDSLGVCKFAFLGATEEEFAAALSGAYGLQISAEELMDVGKRIYALERKLNERFGRGAEHDRLPQKFFDEALGEHSPLPKERFRQAVSLWRRIRGEEDGGDDKVRQEDC